MEILAVLYFWLILFSSTFYTSAPVGEKAIMIILVITIVILALIIFKVIKIKDLRKLSRRDLVFLTGITMLYLISSFITRGYSFRELFANIVVLIFLNIGGVLILSKVDIYKVIRIILNGFNLIAFMSAIFGITCYVQRKSIYLQNGMRYGYTDDFVTGNAIISIMTNPNSYALFASISVIYSMILLLISNNKLYKNILLVNIITQFIGIYLAGSRNAYLFLAGCIAIYVIVFLKVKNKKQIIIGSFLGILATMIILIVFFKEISFVQKVLVGGLTSGRGEIWQAAGEGIRQNFFWGVGIRNSISTIGEFMGNPNNGLGAHNGYISVALANGMIFFGVLISFIIYKLWETIRIKGKDVDIIKLKNLLCCMIIGLLIANIPESILFGDFNIFVIVLWINITFISAIELRLKGDKNSIGY